MSLSDWKEYKIADLVEIIFSGGTPNTKVNEYWNGSLPWLSSGETKNRYINSTEKTITESGAQNSSTRLALSGDVVMASAGQGYTRGQVSFLNIDTFINQSVIAIRANEKVLDKKFLFYNLSSRYEELRAISDSNSIRGSITTKMVKSMNIRIPDLNTQKAIANTLSSIDDKIETSKQINHHLEQMAQAIFKSWFVDFEPFGGEMPSKWQTKPADCFFDISIGKTPPRKENWCFSEDSKDVPWISISDMGKEGLFINKTSEYLTREAIDKFNVKVVPQNTILLSFKLTIGRIAITNCKMSTNEAIAHFKLTNKHALEWLYCFLNNINYAELGNTSSIATAINSKIIKSMLITMPDSSSLSKFHKIAAPIFEEIRNNHGEIESLQNLRNILLPKLLSGEIPVNQATK
ncbi:restriction endonuclease subunit S [Streptococcus sanguinis]|uniref:Restriction modification system DNA specificity subunit n=1 Tax=Streptococcus sanguinis SK330 TaxID=888813 RepID=F2C593_STRSA|nr:restriction endonuclease subunit S [Streptococcus sanguinis]EGF16076.1 restriction modification system DNA specificity subunit [Streptococcus sanguinis SK330]